MHQASRHGNRKPSVDFSERKPLQTGGAPIGARLVASERRKPVELIANEASVVPLTAVDKRSLLV
jgi:hypothetical protein